MKKIRFLIPHIAICVLLFFALSVIDLTQGLLWGGSALIVFFYFASGFLLTNKETRVYEYFMIFFVGVFLWLLCFIFSPSTTNAWGWFFYQFYIIGISLIFKGIPAAEKFIDEGNYSHAAQLVVLLLLPLFFSLLQYLGGLYRKWKLNKNSSKIVSSR